MEIETSESPRGNPWLRATARQLGHDYAYVLPGFPLALLSFCVLVPLLAFSLSTLIVWVGVVVLPLTLIVASGFAQLSRTRLAIWGLRIPRGSSAEGRAGLPGLRIPRGSSAEGRAGLPGLRHEPVHYQPTAPGLMGLVKSAADPRRWLDFVFEALIALPLRLFTFSVCLTWTVAAVAGPTYWFWVLFIPGDNHGWAHLISLANPGLASQIALFAYLLDSGINLALGVVALVTLPLAMRGLAALDALLTTTLLGEGTQMTSQAGHPAGTPAQRTDVTTGVSREHSIVMLIWAVTAVVSIILTAVSWPILATYYDVHPAIAMVLSVTHAAAAILAVRWTWVGLSLSLASVIAQTAATASIASQVVWPWPVTALLTQCLLILVVALRRPWHHAAAVWVASLLPTFVAPVLFTATFPSGTIGNGTVVAGVLAGVALLGILVRLWGLSVSRVEVAEKVSAEEALRRKGLEERNRIARELHDVVAHSMSVITVQASTAKYRRPGIENPVRQEFEEIAESSRQALGEMRALLAILRGDDTAPTAPVPGVQDIADLVEATRTSGASITFSGAHPHTSPTVGLTAFRVVQEALSNALRHAPQASIDVTTAVDDSGSNLTVRVANTAAQSDAKPIPGSGLGLAGLRERVTALGGTFSAGPTNDGGFVVTASLPLHER